MHAEVAAQRVQHAAASAAFSIAPRLPCPMIVPFSHALLLAQASPLASASRAMNMGDTQSRLGVTMDRSACCEWNQ